MGRKNTCDKDRLREWQGNSSIYIDISRDNAWTFFMGYDERGNKKVWNNDVIYTVSWNMLQGDPDLPGLLNIPELTSLGIAMLFDIIFGGTAEIEQIRDEEGKEFYTPNGTLYVDPEKGMRDCFLVPSFADIPNTGMQMYYASVNKKYDFDIAGTVDENYSFNYIPMEGMLTGFTVDTFNNSADKIGIDAKNLSTMFLTQNSKKFSYKMIKEFEEYGKIISISDIETDGNGNATFVANSNGDNVTIINNGHAISYDLKIDYVGNESQTFEYKDVHLGGGEAHCITPISWENLSKSKVRVDIDENNDGIWDEYKLLKQSKKTPGFEIVFLSVAIAVILLLKNLTFHS